MEERCGQGEDPLSEGALGELQSQILGPRATRYGVRRSPVFVGVVDGFTEVIHYIAPHWDESGALLSGLRGLAPAASQAWHEPSVGCPANGSSPEGVKMRTR